MAWLFTTSIEHFWENIRHFAFNNPTIFEIFFLMLYSLEQIILVLLVSNFSTTERLNIIISLFSIVVLGTFAFHKLVMSSRICLLEDKLRDLSYEKIALERLTRELYYSSSQNLNKLKKSVSKKVMVNDK